MQRYAKTLYKPERPAEIDEFLSGYTKRKLPHFFKYAKEMIDEQIAPVNNSLVNKFEKLIKDKRLSFKNMMKFDYTMLMQNKYAEINDEVIKHFIKIKRSYPYFTVFKIEAGDDDNIGYIRKLILQEFEKYDYSKHQIVDMLVSYFYGKKKDAYKSMLWIAFGDIIRENIERNAENLNPYCMRCGKRYKFDNDTHYRKYCPECLAEEKTNIVTKICIDCGKEFTALAKANKSMRCNECQMIVSRERERLKKQRQRAKKKCPLLQN